LAERLFECETHSRPVNWYTRQPKEELSFWRPFAHARRERFKISYRHRYEWMPRRVIRTMQSVVIEEMAIEVQFRSLAQTWKSEARFASSPTQMFLLPSYQRIIGMGPKVIPVILHDLQREPNHWFWALAALTGENPVSPELAGNTQSMREAWMTWARERGYL